MTTPSYTVGKALSARREENLWASLPPLHTIKPNELIQYQIVDWDPNNPNHPQRYFPDRLLIKSLFRRDYYYWIGCSNTLPKEEDKKDPQNIDFTPATASSTPDSNLDGAFANVPSRAENQAPGLQVHSQKSSLPQLND